jgi:hypothetical protein
MRTLFCAAAGADGRAAAATASADIPSKRIILILSFAASTLQPIEAFLQDGLFNIARA